jgi:hypothetical protein
MACLVLTGASHRPVDLSSQFAAKVVERFGQGRDVRWPALRLLEQGLDETVARRAGREHEVPGLDIRVRRRMHGQGESLIYQPPRHRLGQEHPGRMPLSDRLLKVEHGGSCCRTLSRHLKRRGKNTSIRPPNPIS